MDRNYALEFVRVTEAAALASARMMGRGDEKAADHAAVEAMRKMLGSIHFDGTVVIGEGERDEAPMLYIGEKVGKGGTVVNHESERIRKDGSLIHVALTLSPIKDASGNITGISDVASALTTKRLSLLKELSPNLRKVAMLWNKDDLGMTLRYGASAKVALSLGISVQPVGVREPDDFKDAFEVMNSDMPDAILMVADALTNLNRKRVFEFAIAKKLPAIYEYDFIVRDGGLMSYGPDLTESFERAAALVARVFEGVKPADLPFEQPTRYPFFLNLKTASSMGLQIPPTLLALADEVIE